jgi:mRNA interferase MazF
MGAFATRQVILLPFPFSDLSASNLYADSAAVELTDADFVTGSLQRTSYVRPSKLFTANETLFKGTAGLLKADKQSEVVNVIVALLRAGL